MKNATTNTVDQLKKQIQSWDSQSQEVIKDYKDLGVTKASLKRALKTEEERLSAVATNKAEKPTESNYESMYTDMVGYMNDVVADLDRVKEIVPELHAVVDYFTTSMKNIEENSPNEIIKRLKLQLMGQIHNVQLTTFLTKHAAKRHTDTDDISPDAVGQNSKDEKLQEHKNSRAKYTITVFDDLEPLEDMLAALGFDPAKIKTVAGKCIIARFAFRNNLDYINAGSELSRAIQKPVIEAFKAFQQKHFVAWAGAYNTKPEKTYNFFMSLIKLWEARHFEQQRNALNKKTHVEEAIKCLEEAQSFSPAGNTAVEINEMLQDLRNPQAEVKVALPF